MTNTNDTVILIGPQPPTESTGGAGGSSRPYSEWRSDPGGRGGRADIIYTNITIVGGRGGDYIDNGVGVGVFDVIHFFITLVTLILVLRLSIKSDEEDAPEEEESE